MYIQFGELEELASEAEMLVRSLGYHIYTIEFTISGIRKIYSENGREPKQFQNIMSIKETFNTLPIKQAWLMHQSAYDEMVGQTTGDGNDLKIPFDLATPY